MLWGRYNDYNMELSEYFIFDWLTKTKISKLQLSCCLEHIQMNWLDKSTYKFWTKSDRKKSWNGGCIQSDKYRKLYVSILRNKISVWMDHIMAKKKFYKRIYEHFPRWTQSFGIFGVSQFRQIYSFRQYGKEPVFVYNQSTAPNCRMFRGVENTPKYAINLFRGGGGAAARPPGGGGGGGWGLSTIL